jgi:hypothetical protein
MTRTLVLTLFIALAALTADVAAQIVPPPANSTVIDFDDLAAAPDIFTMPGPLSTELADRGVTFSGFGTNGGGVVEYTGAGQSPPNTLVFQTAIVMLNGGLASTPETLAFYPPIRSLQFLSETGGTPCEDTMVVFIEPFLVGGTSLGVTNFPVEADTRQIVVGPFPDPGVDKVVLTSTHTCGTGFLAGVEIFTVDDLAFVPIYPESDCGKAQLKAAGTLANAQTKCHAKAIATGTPVDGACLAQASAAFAKAFPKAAKPGDCVNEDGSLVESLTGNFVFDLVNAVTGGAPGPDICDAAELKAASQKAAGVATCYGAAAGQGDSPDVRCMDKAHRKFSRAIRQCASADEIASLEARVDEFVQSLARTSTVVSTTTTTTETTTTSTTLAPPLGDHLLFTTTAGTANCGGAKLDPPADAPFSGEIDSDTAGTTKLKDLGLGCLYIGGGIAQIPASQTPENADNILESPDGSSLVASSGTGPRDCSKGPAATKHCVNNPAVSCTSDADCAGVLSACAPDASCFFGPPVPINGFPTSCVVNTFAEDASGTIDTATGASTVNINLSSRVFLTLGLPSACPQCVAGTCNYGDNAGGACTTTNAALTSLDCPPGSGTFVSVLPVNLSPLTTGPNVKTAAESGPGPSACRRRGASARPARRRAISPTACRTPPSSSATSASR